MLTTSKREFLPAATSSSPFAPSDAFPAKEFWLRHRQASLQLTTTLWRRFVTFSTLNIRGRRSQRHSKSCRNGSFPPLSFYGCCTRWRSISGTSWIVRCRRRKSRRLQASAQQRSSLSPSKLAGCRSVSIPFNVCKLDKHYFMILKLNNEAQPVSLYFFESF